MIEWSDQHRMIQETVRKFVEAEIVPQLEELEHGDLPPYDVLRKLFKTFGMDELARTRFDRQIARQESAGSSDAEESRAEQEAKETSGDRGDAAAMQLIPLIEISRFCPGMVTAMGVSMGLTAASIMSKGTVAQKKWRAIGPYTLLFLFCMEGRGVPWSPPRNGLWASDCHGV